jgi:hypothetical protein
LSGKDYAISYDKNDPWKTLNAIKEVFKYKLNYGDSRKVLIDIYTKLFLKDYPDALEIMHLNAAQIRQMLRMGHSIGVHSRTHISVAASSLSETDFKKEIIEPRKYLQDMFETDIFAFSYPFGGKQDCLSARKLKSATEEYKLVFTVEKILNTGKTHPYELGRYMPMSTDTDLKLLEVLSGIAAGEYN